jgi:hypothetical protein
MNDDLLKDMNELSLEDKDSELNKQVYKKYSE